MVDLYVVARLACLALQQIQGEVEAHDAQIRQALEELSRKVDVVVFAQASMARAVRGTAHSVPVLTSPVLGVENVKRRLEQR